jgi:hypothetical protein
MDCLEIIAVNLVVFGSYADSDELWQIHAIAAS